MTVTKDKIGSEMHIIEKSDAEKFLKTNSATRSMNVSEAKLGSQRHEDEPSSEKTKKKTSLKSSEVRSILGKKKDYYDRSLKWPLFPQNLKIYTGGGAQLLD
jgi:hypothetical protein